MGTPNVVFASREACEKRFEGFFGKAIVKDIQIIDVAEDKLRESGIGEGTFEVIIEAVRKKAIVTTDLITEMRNVCRRKKVAPDGLSDEEVERIFVREVRRRCAGHINDHNKSGRLRKKPKDVRCRVWNRSAGRPNWVGADQGPNQEVLQLPEFFVDESDPDEEPPPQCKGRGKRKTQPLRVGRVERRLTDGDPVIDAILLNGKGSAVGVASMTDRADSNILRTEGQVDLVAQDKAAQEIFQFLGREGEQQYEVHHVTVRTVIVDRLPPATDILAELRKSNGSSENGSTAKNEDSRGSGQATAQESLEQTQSESHSEVSQS